MTDKKRVRIRAFCPKCDWYLVLDYIIGGSEGRWFCHRCDQIVDAKLREVS